MELLGKTILFYLVFFFLSWLIGRWFDPPPESPVGRPLSDRERSLPLLPVTGRDVS